jgi:uncharacterized tellurite resistance protein B-like protein
VKRAHELATLTRAERMQLLGFVTSFAWADLNITRTERAFVHRLVKRLHLDPAEAKEVEGWLSVPPAPDDVDPSRVPAAHRQLFIDVVREMMEADGDVTPEERESFQLLEQLTR